MIEIRFNNKDFFPTFLKDGQDITDLGWGSLLTEQEKIHIAEKLTRIADDITYTLTDEWRAKHENK